MWGMGLAMLVGRSPSRRCCSPTSTSAWRARSGRRRGSTDPAVGAVSPPPSPSSRRRSSSAGHDTRSPRAHPPVVDRDGRRRASLTPLGGSIQVADLTSLEFSAQDHAYGSIFYVLAGGMVALALVGVVIDGVVLAAALRGRVQPAPPRRRGQRPPLRRRARRLWVIGAATLYLTRLGGRERPMRSRLGSTVGAAARWARVGPPTSSSSTSSPRPPARRARRSSAPAPCAPSSSLERSGPSPCSAPMPCGPDGCGP